MTEKYYPHTPNWVTSPGDTLEEMMEWQKTSREQLSESTGTSLDVIDGIIEGEVEITEEYADLLAGVTTVSRETWLNFERHYREGLANGLVPLRNRNAVYD
ncbi:MAG: hypothetical protein LBT05_04385 [Planctomycetaceae bacterium]|jgi:HTH-type transcriptional regulator/antitoxin HigA|nr:hypothetical protein [Planctomycetaceae bacterium]